MKKLKVLILLLFAVSLSGYSQTYFKIKLGMNMSKGVYLNKKIDQIVKDIRRQKPGIAAGFALHQIINKVLSVQAELLYSQKGLKTKQVPFATSINTMNYLTLPITGHYSVFKTRNSAINLYIGAYGAFWTDGKYKRIDYYTKASEVKKVDFKNPKYAYSRIDFGILTGMLYNIKSFDFFLRYTHSMTGSSKSNTDAISNRVFCFGVNYIINR